MSSITLESVNYSYERYGQVVPAIIDLSFDITHSQFLVVGGANGSGKSTLLRLISGELEPLTCRFRTPDPGLCSHRVSGNLQPIGVCLNFRQTIRHAGTPSGRTRRCFRLNPPPLSLRR